MLKSDTASNDRWIHCWQGGKRAFFIPTASKQVQQTCLDYLVTSKRRAFWIKAQLRAFELMRINGFLSNKKFASSLFISLQEIQDRWCGEQHSRLGVILGPPGALQKATVLVVGVDGDAKTLIKFSLTAMANKYIRKEAEWLLALIDIDGIKENIPQLEEQGKLLNGNSYLIQTIGPKETTSHLFTEAHDRFLSTLCRTTTQTLPILSTKYFQEMKHALTELHTKLDRSIYNTLARSLKDYEQRVSGSNGPVAWAHRDFVASNIRAKRNQIYVFDWEYASDDANALQDIFHFFLAYEALHKGRIRPRVFRMTLARAGSFATRTYPDYHWTPKIVNNHMLGYLLDVLIFYASTSGKVNLKNPLVNNYWKIVNERESWIDRDG